MPDFLSLKNANLAMPSDIDRFELRGELGRGGMGVVHEAFDRERGELVALKALAGTTAESSYRLKQEFRALAEVSHPNLVTLHELFSLKDICFFTMELVRGLPFTDYVWGCAPTHDRAGGRSRHDNDSGRDVTLASSRGHRLNLARLRNSLVQLTQGLLALHGANKVHRDIKPSNVLVTASGRVVLLDFGLASDLFSGPGRPLSSERFAGTPVYMSPEQLEGNSPTPYSDWYSMGVMLYHALTGLIPHDAPDSGWVGLLENRRAGQLTPPHETVPSIPEDISLLCMELLRVSPLQRPDGSDILERLGNLPGYSEVVSSRSHPLPNEPPLVGREGYLRLLHDALVHGGSGVGKTALARQLLKTIADSDGALVLEGCCYERESVAFKALDAMIDSLSRHLLTLQPDDARRTIPADAWALGRVFPVLQRVPCIAEQVDDAFDAAEPQEVRRLAFASLRNLLTRMVATRPLCLFVDDLQWTDLDSVLLLAELLRHPDAPALFFLGCYRGDSAGSESAVDRLVQALEGISARRFAFTRVELGVLSPNETLDLVRREAGNQWDCIALSAIAQESKGIPFLVHELTRYAVQRLANSEDREATATVDQMVWERFSSLADPAQSLMQVVVAAGTPVRESVARAAAQLGEDDFATAMALLRANHFISTVGTGELKLVAYHDGLRETIYRRLPEARIIAIHQHIATSMEHVGGWDAESLVENFRRALEPERAYHYARQAANEAMLALAFDRAVRLYRLTMELLPRAADDLDLRLGLAEALSCSGRAAEAARQFLIVADKTAGLPGMQLRRRAAEHFLVTGYIQEGLEVMDTVLRASGLKLARTPRTALLSFLINRLKLRIRGLKYAERSAEEVSPDELARVDTCWAVAVGLGNVDTIRAADFQTRHLLLALKAGEPNRIARAVALEVAFVALPGGPSRPRVERLLGFARALAHRLGNARVSALAMLAAGLAEHLVGKWRESFEYFEKAETLLTKQCVGALWELSTAHRYLTGSLLFMGQLQQLYQRQAEAVAAARERGNIYAATSMLARSGHFEALCADAPERAQLIVEEAMRHWPQREFLFPHYNELWSRAQIYLYRGDCEQARHLVESRWRSLSGSMLTRIQVIRVESLHLRARVALACVGERSGDHPAFKLALRVAKQIERENMPWSNPFAALLRATVARRRGNRDLTAELLHVANAGFGLTNMELYQMATRMRLAQVVPSDDARRTILDVNEWMRERGILKPGRIVDVLAPGFLA
jgi:serine/threonine protein kinase/tetratricopeptide (TPR) repeat protein